MLKLYLSSAERFTLAIWMRQRSENVLKPIAAVLNRWHVTPLGLTLAATGMAILSGVIVTLPDYRVVAGALFLGSGFLDVLDGSLARSTNSVSNVGAFLDSTLDQYSDIAIYFGFAWTFLRDGSMEPVLLVFAAMAGSLLVSYTKARAGWLGIECRIGLMTRFERVILISFALFSGYVIQVLWIIAVFSNVTAIQRFIYIIQAARKKDMDEKDKVQVPPSLMNPMSVVIASIRNGLFILVRRLHAKGVRTTLAWLYERAVNVTLGIPIMRFCRVTRYVHVGPQPKSRGMRRLSLLGIHSIVNLRTKCEDGGSAPTPYTYCYLPIFDTLAPSIEQLNKGVSFVQNEIRKGNKVYIHCRNGVGRSPTMTAAYFISQGMSLDNAIALIEKVRPFVHIESSQRRQLELYESSLRADRPVLNRQNEE